MSAAEDSDADDGAATITHAANSSDPGYDGNAVSIASVRATEQDDDRHGITVSPTALAVPEGGSRTFSVVLNTRPSARVWVAASIAGDADLGMSPSARVVLPVELERAADLHGVGGRGRRRDATARPRSRSRRGASTAATGASPSPRSR